MNKLTAVALTLVLTGTSISSVMAAPQVNGSTISWPANGWYQVLNADDFTEVCGGLASCDVNPGRYIIINHTTGERFENIVVRDRSGSAMPVSVSGNTISWPDDGYYQVQRANDYSTVCEGGRSCEVENGVYTVINHSIKTRFNGILVDNDVDTQEPSTPEQPDIEMGVVVTGNVISWPDNGWYQVQNLESFESICEGGTSCTVSDGVYVVINHSTGERFEPYIITTDDINPGEPEIGNEIAAGSIPIPVNARLDESAPYLIESLAGYQLEQALGYIETVADEVVSTAASETVLSPGSRQIDVRGDVQTSIIDRTEYGCSGGGSLVRNTSNVDIDFSDFSQDSLLDVWTFQDCLLDTQAGDLLEGEHLLNGVVARVSDFQSGSRFTNSEQSVTYSDFSLQAPANNSLTIDGNVRTRSLNTQDPDASRIVVINDYSEIRNGNLLRDIRDGSFSYSTGTTANGAVINQKVSAEGRILGSVTQGQDITITTPDLLERSGVVNDDFASFRVPFRGQMQFSSTDGSELSIMPKPDAPEFFAPLLYNDTLLTAEGDVVNGTDKTLPTFAISIPEADFYQR